VDGNLVGNASIGISRPDVCAAYPGRPGCPNVGYAYSLNTSGLAGGLHILTVSATDSDSTPEITSLSVPFTIAGVQPLVFIDTPTSGAVLSGTATISGWAIDASSTGTAIGSVQVKVDGTLVGIATYGVARPDVCAAFPNRPGCPNVGWTFALDTTKFAAGAHTLTVVVADTDGNPDLGSWTTGIVISQMR